MDSFQQEWGCENSLLWPHSRYEWLTPMEIMNTNIHENQQANENTQHTISSIPKRVFDPRLDFDEDLIVTHKEQFLTRRKGRLPEALLYISVTLLSSPYVPGSILEIT